MGHNRFKKPDIMLVLAVVVGLGAVLSTSVQAEERPVEVPSALLVSYPGALPMLEARLARMASQASGLVKQAQALVPSSTEVADLMTVSPTDPSQVYMAFEAPALQPEVLQLQPENSFDVEEDFVPTLVFRHRW